MAADIAWLWWILLGGAAALTALVLGLLAAGWRAAPQPEADPPGGERLWTLGLGVAFTLSVLVAIVAIGLWVGERQFARADGTLRVEAQAHRWGWSFRQPGPDGAPVWTRDVLYIPAGQDVDVDITSTDVIHSFWVPRLGGKMDAIPGRTNLHRLHADEPGRYEGLCAEFCGQGHSFMRFAVVAYAGDGAPPVDTALILGAAATSNPVAPAAASPDGATDAAPAGADPSLTDPAVTGPEGAAAASGDVGAGPGGENDDAAGPGDGDAPQTQADEGTP